MKRFHCFLMVSILALSFLGPFFLYAQEKKDGEEVYTIKKGDTLWDISSRFMKNPFLWPKLWQRNPYITNPHWIYPGNPVRLTPLEEPKMEEATKEEPKKVVAAGEKSGEGVIEPEEKKAESPEGIKTEASVEKKTHEQKPLVFPEIRTAGFFSDIDYRGIGYIVESKEGKNYLSAGDICYIEFRDKGPVSIGERFTTFRSYQGFAAMDIRIGRKYNITGVIQLIDRYGDFYTARILESFQEIIKGDFIMPYNKEKMGAGLGTQ